MCRKQWVFLLIVCVALILLLEVVYYVTEDKSSVSSNTVVPALGDPRRERPPAVYGHVINVPIHLNVPIRPSDERPPALYGHFCLVPRVSVHDRYYCSMYVITW